MTFFSRNRSLLCAALILPLYFVCASPDPAHAAIIPSNRIIDWKPGIPGGIPTYPVGVNVKDHGARGDGRTDDTKAIQSAIDACPAGRAVYIPEGSYRLTGELRIFAKGIVLRGAGMNKTLLMNESTTGSILKFSNSGGSSVSVTGGYARGSRTITVRDAASFKANDTVMISQENDPAVVVVMDYMKRTMAQIFKIDSISGNTLTVNRPLYFSYNPSRDILLTKIVPIKGAGVEDLYMRRVRDGGGDNIEIINGVNCWVRNVHSHMVRKWHVRLRQSYACEVRESYFQDGHQFSGDSTYGVGCFSRSTDNLIENNIFYRMRHSMIIEWGGSGNVYGYNYSRDPLNEGKSNTTFLMSDISLHGGHPYMNLFEGNIAAHIDADNYLGSSSHNTFFRNHIERKGLPATRYGLWAVELQMSNLYANVVGNVLCAPNSTNSGDSAVWRLGYRGVSNEHDRRVEQTLLRHGNYNHITKSTEWDPNIADRSIPNSLYHSSKPPFFGSTPWPAIGPDRNPLVTKIPALVRFEAIISGKAPASTTPGSPGGLRIQ
jgi:hypothetical protein